MLDIDSKRPHTPRCRPPHSGVELRPPRATVAKEDVPGIDPRPGILEIFEDRLSHFVLDRILLSPAVLCAPNGEDFALPIEVLQT